MKHIKNACLALLLILTSACVSQKSTPTEDIGTIKAPEQKMIALENLKTRVIAYCYASEDFSAEQCAKDLEIMGYVRLTDIPKFTADRDFLTTGTYPTRRWRETDRAPRW